ncbi:hypothetical protein OGAPHI_006861 [Ogataea philodendri]|uniref:Uncharacterized protein n=1 Tax=Ogataea philodendri TaxID=1378263 RepID=A0A9P8SZV7_9ASCO|nr:uncharacterized protein OGAPHI_006861 [Ogataea philodendri]KAH3660275.1 hypothetical protein OGAPHI_006861 [Ogataea philodendri]
MINGESKASGPRSSNSASKSLSSSSSNSLASASLMSLKSSNSKKDEIWILDASLPLYDLLKVNGCCGGEEGAFKVVNELDSYSDGYSTIGSDVGKFGRGHC